MAASEELRHTTISDRVNPTTAEQRRSEPGSAPLGGDKEMGEHVRNNTPEHDELKERLSSPKKKRGRDFEDDMRDTEEVQTGENGLATASGTVSISRTSRSEPEKKRPRDASEETAAAAKEAGIAKMAPEDSGASRDLSTGTKHVFGSGLSDKPQTSSSAFMNSGFGALSSSATSPFGTIGASKLSVFGGSTQPAQSGFGALAGATQPNSSAATTGALATGTAKPSTGFSFGSGASTSGFGALSSGGAFGSALGNGFAGGSGPKLSSFAAPPGKGDVAPAKAAKAFGAPESDEDDDGDDEDSEEPTEGGEEDSTKAPEDKKKLKVFKTHVEDGESGEATLLQIRAKLFALDSKEKGWKERGVGTLKVNVPECCATFDENGAPIPGSFDVSGLEDEEEGDIKVPKVPRLIMRQENTHRVILNTILVKAMEFKDKPSTSGAQILFTAFEGEKEPKPINMLLKMSEANFKLFRSEIDSIQHEL
ncbi:hypothetical protein OIDMADRAFT_188154 [Oidiodendron maius Zn]|uniref:RanBD1 domain-containing protein n=1 Tax=Oidiodendron maius (strain Zn) TaxID=913774 RepID=A0A0C3HK32_OIDMZ|nr:hypothetical protein OIDMADRAFT_188154 [Oidiodendron maius Zn]